MPSLFTKAEETDTGLQFQLYGLDEEAATVPVPERLAGQAETGTAGTLQGCAAGRRSRTGRSLLAVFGTT